MRTAISKIRPAFAAAMLVVLSAIALCVFAAPGTYANKDLIGDGVKQQGDRFGANTSGESVYGTVEKLLRGVFVLVGIISVCMVVYGGVKYSISAGDQGKVTSAKNTITYAIIGLVVSLSAYAILTFVTGRLT